MIVHAMRCESTSSRDETEGMHYLVGAARDQRNSAMRFAAGRAGQEERQKEERIKPTSSAVCVMCSFCWAVFIGSRSFHTSSSWMECS